MELLETPILFFCLFFFFGGLSGLELMFSYFLWKYLKEHHYEKWAYLTSTENKGPGCTNCERAFLFIYGEDNFGDEYVGKMKERIRRIIKYLLITLVAMVALFGYYIFVAIWKTGNV